MPDGEDFRVGGFKLLYLTKSISGEVRRADSVDLAKLSRPEFVENASRRPSAF